MSSELIKILVVFGIIAIPSGYLLGSLSNSILISKYYYRKDVRDHGSHNAGGTNTARVLGPKIGILVIILDMIKSAGLYWALNGVMLGFNLTSGPEAIWAQVISLVSLFTLTLGHNFPLFFKFKGGKGVAFYAGILVASNWIFTIVGLIIFVLIVVIKKYVSLSSMVTSSILALISLIYLVPELQNFGYYYSYTNPLVFALALFLLAGFIIYQHRGNIARLLSGTENKIGQSNAD